jgi:two-component system chemotaxis response regulator CheY
MSGGDTARPTAAAWPEAGAQQPTCLIVDDSRTVRRAARRMLEAEGFTVNEAEDGAQALAACRAALPALVLLDWNMPVMDGPTFLRLARTEFGPDRPVIMLCTTESGLDRIVTALEAGAQEYVMKPFDETILHDKLAQIGLLPMGNT